MTGQELQNKKTFGLAMSGSGNRTPFYIGFLEELDAAGLKIDYISACSGGSLVAAAYSCGGLLEIKKFMLDFDYNKFKQMIKRSSLSNGGLYSLELVEEELLKITKGKKFEEVYPKMTFAAVDIESGELVHLCMGDIARAAIISCALPGLFEPVRWGGRTLVDGGLLIMIPSEALNTAGIDIKVGINMRGTKHIFTEGQMTIKKVFDFLKKLFLIDYLKIIASSVFKEKESDVLKKPGFFTVLGKSMDLAIKASRSQNSIEPGCDLLITPEIPKDLGKDSFKREDVKRYYELGIVTAKQYIPKIKQLLEVKN